LLQQVVDRVLSRLNMGVQGCSLQGIAATLMSIGSKSGATMHSMFSINIEGNKKRKSGYLKVLFPTLERVRLIIIDEISMISASHLALIDNQLKKALLLYRTLNEEQLNDLDIEKDFLGMHLICLGDFFQIPPIAATSLPTAMVQRSISQHMKKNRSAKLKLRSLAGADLFSKFVVKFLSQQVRASSDPVHTKFLESFSTLECPITQERIDNIQDYTPELVMRDPAFLYAPILVSTNVSMANCNHVQIACSVSLLLNYVLYIIANHSHP